MFAAMYGRDPNGLFIPPKLAAEFVAACDDLDALKTGLSTIQEGVVLDKFDGLSIRLCTGEQIGVGLIREDDTTPPHTAIWTD